MIFNTGQRLADLPDIVAATHAAGGRILLDVYHALGVFPVDVAALDVDFAVGGSYKYLRGGPGACFLYLHPRHLDGALRTLDTGWFAKREPFAYVRPDPPEYAAGGDAFLESTPPVLPFYQARAGQRVGAGAWASSGCARIRSRCSSAGRPAARSAAFAAHGGTEDRGAFVVVDRPRAEALAHALQRSAAWSPTRAAAILRLCPDILTTDEELATAVDRLATVAG